MKNHIFFFSLLIALLAAVIPCFAEDNLIYSNFNNDPVKNNPEHYPVFPVSPDYSPVLIKKIRTYHWNNGNGAEPGTICIREGNTTKELQCWQAVGVSAYGVPNVYWEVQTDFVMEPGQSYGIKDSDFESWSNNEGSKYFGMLELYGKGSSEPNPNYNTSASANSGSAIPSAFHVGQTFMMGQYEQDDNISSGKEPIEWQVLTVKNGNALVISRYGLEVIDHETLTGSTTWDTNTYRTWLNGEFYNSSFSDAEKSRILTVKNENMANPVTGIKSGKQTQDKVFLLALDEAEYYFRSNEERKCSPTPYARTKSTNSHNDGTSTWVLRTAGMGEDLKALVLNDGSVEYWGLPCDAIEGCNKTFFLLRPAFWLSPTDIPEDASNQPDCFKVTYDGNNCLAKVPSDNQCYELGDLVTILFEPAESMDGMVFYGWDMDDDGMVDFSTAYPTFAMPSGDVVLKASCYRR